MDERRLALAPPWPTPVGSARVEVAGMASFIIEGPVLERLGGLAHVQAMQQGFAGNSEQTVIHEINCVDQSTFEAVLAGIRASLYEGHYGQRVTDIETILQRECPTEQQTNTVLHALDFLQAKVANPFGTAFVVHCVRVSLALSSCLGRSYDELLPSVQNVLRYGAHALLNDMLCHALREPGFTVDDPPLWLPPLAREILKNKTLRAPEKIQSLLREYKDWRLLHCVPGVCALTVLDLDNNKLSTLPPQIGAFGNLRTLSLNNNKLRTLPPQIGDLVNLRELWLNNSKLSTLPPQIGALVNLQKLWLVNNKLSTLPPQIGALVNLQSLCLVNNKLRTLPPQIGALGKLRVLDLDNNKFSTLPLQIGALGNLQELWIKKNRFTPDSITSIRNALPLHCEIYAGEQRTSN